jgi:hypothetical protein
MSAEAAPPPAQNSDARVQFLCDRVCSSLKCGAAAFDKLLQTEQKECITSFLDDEQARRLLVFLDGKDLGAVRPDDCVGSVA